MILNAFSFSQVQRSVLEAVDARMDARHVHGTVRIQSFRGHRANATAGEDRGRSV